MNKPGLILVGAGGHARSCIDVIEAMDRYRIEGLIGTVEEQGSAILGYDIIADDDKLPSLIESHEYALVTVGQISSPATRVRLFQRIIDLGFKAPVIISPAAQVSPHAKIGAGSIVMHGAVVNAGASVGCNCIVNSQALVEHDSLVEDHCHISTGAILNGGVFVGEGSFIGSGSVVKESVSIGKESIIGMGMPVKCDQAAGTKLVK